MTAFDLEKPMYSLQVANTSREDRGNIRRSRNQLAHPELGVDGVQTLYEAFRRGKAINPMGPCLGFRAVSTSGEATPFLFSSFTECVARVDAIAAGLADLELVKPNPEDGILLLGLYMKNSMEWILAEHAIYCLGGATVPMYDTLGPDTAQFILTQTSMNAVVCTRAELKSLCIAKKSGSCPSFRCVILVDGVIPDAATMAQEAELAVIALAKVEGVGAQVISTHGHKHSPPSRKDIATFCYTSGTTGNPKGALLTHENLISASAGFKDVLPLAPYDRHLSYLPLAHIFERTVAAQVLLKGASIGFFRGDPLLLIEDIQALRPTILPAAPRVLNKIHDKVMAGIAAAGGMKKKLFDAALAAKTEGLLHNHLKHAFYDRLIFNKIKRALGMDCIRLMVSGSAPLSENVMMFFRCMLGVPVLEGYGQTEGAAAATISCIDDMSTVGHVGGPTDCCEVVLVDVPEMGYFHTDTEHRGQPCQGRGEIWIRGPHVFIGYYKEPEKTKEMLDHEGWLHSGDIGLWTTRGQLQIIDRKKNIFKLAQGEYVAPEKVENILSRSPLVSQCFVHGDSFQSSLVCVVVPDEEPVRAWASSKDQALASQTISELCQSEHLRNVVLEEIKTIAKANGLHGFETPRAVFLDHNVFSVEKDLVTPTFKLKRPKLRAYYEKEIAQMYADMPPPMSKL